MTFAAPSAIVGGGRKWMLFAVDFLQALTAGILHISAYALMCIGLGIIFGAMNVIGPETLVVLEMAVDKNELQTSLAEGRGNPRSLMVGSTWF